MSTATHKEPIDAPTTASTDKAHDGYPSLACVMSSYPDFAIFRRFGQLNRLNLLRLQAELQKMEHDLKVTREEDFMSKDEKRVGCAKDFREMRERFENGDSEQYGQLVDIGKKLHEYNTALALALQLKVADQPKDRELNHLREWLNRPKSGHGFLVGKEARMWETECISEYVTLYPRDLEIYAFTSFLSSRLLDIYHIALGHKRRKKFGTEPRHVEVRRYSDRKIARAGDIAVAVLSSVLPTLAILVLYLAKRMIVRIGLVILFTAVFSVALALFTAARKVEVFSATAAFAAVEVVFIGSSNSTG